MYVCMYVSYRVLRPTPTKNNECKGEYLRLSLSISFSVYV